MKEYFNVEMLNYLTYLGIRVSDIIPGNKDLDNCLLKKTIEFNFWSNNKKGKFQCEKL